ncbi:MAG TPA: hypothetical protein VMB23_07585 [Spirochaetia bacterium]|nr:hypothetical protein [Spirochaetia bacterium]
MKNLGLGVLAVLLLLVGCTPDRTLETLVPRNSFAVVLVDHPAAVSAALGAGAGDLPWSALEGNKPWAAAVVPASPPGFLLALALADRTTAWPTVQAWARERGGLDATRVGTYAVLSSPGLPVPSVLDRTKRFDLTRVRAGGDPVALYVDVKNVMDAADFPEALRPAFAVLPWAEKNLAGVRLGFNGKDGGLELRVATDWKPGATVAPVVKTWVPPSDPAGWTGLLPRTDGIGAVVSLPPSALGALGALVKDPALGARWSALAPLIGPRIAAAAGPRPDGTWAWGAAVETSDPQAVRQALRTLVASGDLQKNFEAWALDADTPVIYQDRPDGRGGVLARLSVGAVPIYLGYGSDRVVVSGTPDGLVPWTRDPGAPTHWVAEAPQGSSVVAQGSLDGLGARGAIKALADGNLEARLWIDAAGVKAWEERFPQAALSWLSGAGGLTRWEP